MKTLIEKVNKYSKIIIDVGSVKFERYMCDASYNNVSVARYEDEFDNYILIPEINGTLAVRVKWRDERTLKVSNIYSNDYNYCDAFHIENIYDLLDSMAS
jgi:hypothetical protein